ncbi:MAG: fibronectin type III domain-containing protein [Bacteroidota bacterium]
MRPGHLTSAPTACLSAILLFAAGWCVRAQCTPPLKNTLLIARDNGVRKDTVFFGHHPLATRGRDSVFCERELPPPPPSGIFEVRFVNPPGYESVQPPAGMGQGFYYDYRAQTGPSQIDTHRVRFQPGSGGYPMTFSWSIPTLLAMCDSAHLTDEFGGTNLFSRMHEDSSAVLTNPSVGTLLVLAYGSVETPGAPDLVSPPDGATGLPAAVTLTWSVPSWGRLYRVQVSADSLFGPVFLDDSLIAVPSHPIQLPSPGSTWFWRVRASNYAGTGPWSEASRFRVMDAPEAPLLVSPPDGAGQRPLTLTFRWDPSTGAVSYDMQAATDSLFLNAVLDTSGLGTTACTAGPFAGGTPYFWRVRGVNTGGAGSWSGVRHFTTLAPVSLPYSVFQGWNMISLAQEVADPRAGVVFPEAVSRAYSFGPAGYLAGDTLAGGRGYWLKFDSAGAPGVFGLPVLEDTTGISAGWNLVGTVFHSLAATAVGSIPPGILSSPFYGYGPGYAEADTLRPGKAFWVKSTSQGLLILPNASTEAAAGAHQARKPEGVRKP